jgi:hypothetical protein
MKANWILCLAAGLIGGVVSHYALVQPVEAQVFTRAPREVRAQSFVLENAQGQTEATILTRQYRGNDVVEIVGKDGRVLWGAGGPFPQPLAMK